MCTKTQTSLEQSAKGHVSPDLYIVTILKINP
uniref:Uncharacterized protein n=1 Tax=Rhizophora mucronata TaxID=61149 RepID=A0A2P2MXJ2_RHIMU